MFLTITAIKLYNVLFVECRFDSHRRKVVTFPIMHFMLKDCRSANRRRNRNQLSLYTWHSSVYIMMLRWHHLAIVVLLLYNLLLLIDFIIQEVLSLRFFVVMHNYTYCFLLPYLVSYPPPFTPLFIFRILYFALCEMCETNSVESSVCFFRRLIRHVIYEFTKRISVRFGIAELH